MRDINFFKPYKNGKDEEEKIYYSLLVVGMILIIVLTSTINITKIVFLQKDIAHYETLLLSDEIKEQIKISEEVNNKLSALTKYDKDLEVIVKDIQAKDIVTQKLLNDITTTIPSDVEFKSMNIDGNGVNIQGIAKSRISVSELQHNLKSLEIIKDVYIQNIDENNINENEFSFSAQCYLNIESKTSTNDSSSENK